MIVDGIAFGIEQYIYLDHVNQIFFFDQMGCIHTEEVTSGMNNTK